MNLSTGSNIALILAVIYGVFINHQLTNQNLQLLTGLEHCVNSQPLGLSAMEMR